VPVAVVVQRYATRWWEQALGGGISRAWTTDNCLNFVEIPLDAYTEATNTIRVVYADGPCAEYWADVHRGDPSNAAMAREIRASLSYLFQTDVPEAAETVYQHWPNAWHFQYPRAQRGLLQLEEWATRPLPGEDVALVPTPTEPPFISSTRASALES